MKNLLPNLFLLALVISVNHLAKAQTIEELETEIKAAIEKVPEIGPNEYGYVTTKFRIMFEGNSCTYSYVYSKSNGRRKTIYTYKVNLSDVYSIKHNGSDKVEFFGGNPRSWAGKIFSADNFCIYFPESPRFMLLCIRLIKLHGGLSPEAKKREMDRIDGENWTNNYINQNVKPKPSLGLQDFVNGVADVVDKNLSNNNVRTLNEIQAQTYNKANEPNEDCGYAFYRSKLTVNGAIVQGCFLDAAKKSIVINVRNNYDEIIDYYLWYRNETGSWQSIGAFSIKPNELQVTRDNCTGDQFFTERFYIVAFKHNGWRCSENIGPKN